MGRLIRVFHFRNKCVGFTIPISCETLGFPGNLVPRDYPTLSQNYLGKISNWTQLNVMKLNAEKSKYMTVNFTENYQFSTILSLENKKLEQVKETRLLGVVINDKLTWHSNTESIVRKPTKEWSFYKICFILAYL